MDKKKKIIIIGVITLVLVIIGTTYAILTWTSNKINIGLNSACFTIDYTKGQDISGNLKLIDFGSLYNPNNNTITIKEGMGLSYVNLGIKSTCTIGGYGSIYLNVTELSDTFKEGGNSYRALGVMLLKNTSNLSNNELTIENLKGQSFEMIDAQPITNTGTIKLVTEQLSNTKLNKYLVIIAVDSNSAGNDITSATFNGNISADAEQLVPTPGYCFNITNTNDEDMTASIGNNGYNCYESNSKGYETITDVVIPEKINGYTITSIGLEKSEQCRIGGQCAMNGKGLTSVVIPNTVKKIETWAFEQNQLTMVVIPDTVTTIEYMAFAYNQLTNVTIPDSVTSIGNAAFAYNQLTNITIPDSVTSIGNDAFGYNNLSWVLINSDSNLTDIYSAAFSSSSQTQEDNGITYVDNPNLKIYNNSGKAFDWNNIVIGRSGTPFVTGTTTATDKYNAVTVTTGQPN